MTRGYNFGRHGHRIESILRYLREHPEMTAEQGVHKYMQNVLWSSTRDEFDRMSDEDRKQFYTRLEQER